jgi:hypothetical protein
MLKYKSYKKGDMMRISDVKMKIVSTDGENVDFAIKALVFNDSRDDDVLLDIQALDEEGFGLYGIIPVGESRVLTTKTDDVKKSLYDQIALWQIK